MIAIPTHPEMVVGPACVRLRFRHASCRACEEACPAAVFSLADGLVRLDPTRCTSCGNCLFACPAGAISGVSPRTRFVAGDTLTGPFSPEPPLVAELLLWHAHYGVRFIDVGVANTPGWMLVLASLNLLLRQFGEPVWSFKPSLKNEVNMARRVLMHIPRDNVRAATVPPGKRLQRRAFSRFSEIQIMLHEEKCVLCGACWRSCSEEAIRFEDETVVMEPARCTGCGGCEAVCHQQALTIAPGIAEARIITHRAQKSTCEECRRPFQTFTPEKRRCYLCERHRYSMRNPACC